MWPDYFHDVTDCYWIMPDGTLYSSARDGFCSTEDSLYQKWLQSGGVPAPCPKNLAGQASWLELMKVLAPYGLGITNLDAYEQRGDSLYKIKFTKKEFLLWCGLESIVKLNLAIDGGNMTAKTVHDLLFAAEFIDVTDADTKQMVNILTTGAAESVLTTEEAARILTGKLYKKGLTDDAA
jgi:hypothetical protein